MSQAAHRITKLRPKVGATIAAITAAAAIGAAASPAAAAPSGFNRPGNILIADQFNNRVIEIDRSHHIVWQFGIGPKDFTRRSIIGVNDAERIGDLTLMAGTGTPPNTVPTCPSPQGCPDNRVLLVDPEGDIVWQYGKFGPGGSGADQLNTPVQATYLPNQDILITDQANERVIEVNQAKQIVWHYGHTGITGNTDGYLNNPNSAQLLPNGNVLIADENNLRAIEVSRAGHVLRSFTDGGKTSFVAFASRLANGDTLLTDSGNNRAIEVNASDQFVWQYVTNMQPGSNTNPAPTRAVRLRNDDTLISDQFNDRVIEVDSNGNIVFQQGKLNVPGTNGGLLWAPYDAKVNGDFTGLTNPFGD